MLLIIAACVAGMLVCQYRPQSADVWIEKVMPLTLLLGALAGGVVGTFDSDGVVESALVCGLIPTAMELISLLFRASDAVRVIKHAPEVERYLLAWFDKLDQSGKASLITLDMLRTAALTGDNGALVLHIIAYLAEVGHLVSSEVYPSIPGHAIAIEVFEISRADITGGAERDSYRVRASQKYSGWCRTRI